MSYGSTRLARSPSYGLSSYSNRTMPSYTSTYSSSYTPASYRTSDYSSTSNRSRTTARDDYTSKYSTTSTLPRTRPSSVTRYRSPSHGRDDYSRSTPVDTTGRPLPKGPGTRDRYGQPVDHKEHLSTLRTTLSRGSSVNRDVPRGPVRATYGVGTNTESTTKLTRGKRTNSVADLANRFESMDVKTSRRYGSNADLSGSTSSRSSDLGTSYTSSRKRTTSENYSPLPDISINQKTSRSPSLDGRDSFDSKRQDSDDTISPSRASTDSLYGRSSSNTWSKANGHGSDYNNNNKGVVGLRNIGNTCFMNSVLQCLSNTPALLEYCLDDDYRSEINTKTSSMKGQLVKVFASLIKSIWKGNGESAVTPSEFKSQIAKFAKRFVGYNQQDAQEFLIYLLEGLHEDVNRVQEKKKRIIDDSDAVEYISASEKAKMCWNNYLDHDNSKVVELFVGQLKSALTCTVCDYTSNTFDPFWDLSLPITKNSSSVSLEDCFDFFTQEETLERDERPMCAKCKKRQRCKKGFTIQKFPKVLIIHLKRFNQGSYYRSKLSTTVDFPLTGLDLSEYAAEKRVSAVYNLFAVSNHSGSTGGGHYTAYAKNPYSGQWHYFNDQSVSSVSESRVKSSEGYVLFYQLQGSSSRL